MSINKELEDLKTAYARLFDTDDGKLVWDDLRKACGQDHTSMPSGDNPNALTIAFNEGKRRVFLRIQSMRKESQ